MYYVLVHSRINYLIGVWGSAMQMQCDFETSETLNNTNYDKNITLTATAIIAENKN